MSRREGAPVRAHGVSMSLRSRAVGPFSRSERINPKDRTDQRRTAGFIATQVDDGTVKLQHHLGTRHGVVKTADRDRIVDEHLDRYQTALQDRFRITKVGAGEQAHLLLRDTVNPLVAQTLLTAAERFAKGGVNDPAARMLRRWAKLAEDGETW